MVARERTVTAHGGSMGPFIPSGSSLIVERLESGRIRRGDIICYIDETAWGVAHRVVDMRSGAEGVSFLVRGDVQDQSEAVPEQAVLYRVKRVSFRGVSYACDGRAGVLLRRIALADGPATCAAKIGLCAAWRVLVFGRATMKGRLRP